MKQFFLKTGLPLMALLLCLGNARADDNVQINLKNILLASDGLSATFDLWVTAQPTYTGSNAGWDTLFYRADASVGTYNIVSVDVLPTSAVDPTAVGYITNPGPPPVGSGKFGLTFTRTKGEPDLVIGSAVQFATVKLHFILPVKSGSADIVSRSPPNYPPAQSTYYTNSNGVEYYAITFLNSVLPIDIVSFTGVKNNSGNQLSWTTANPINFSRFEIQRSIDGNNFIGIAQVQPNNSNTYNYTDAGAMVTSFYRLVLIDVDGSLHYSNTIAVISNNESFIISSVYPVPATNTLNVDLYAQATTNVTYSITDLNGKIITSEMHAALSLTTQPLNVSSFAAGTYFLTVDAAGIRKVVKFIKVKR
jgi:hypothetical protein